MPTYTTSVEFSDTPEGRNRRREWVDRHEPTVRAATMATVNEVSEANATFVEGYFLGSFAVAVAAIEQILYEQLPENTGSPWTLQNIAEKARAEGVIDEDLEAALLEINEVRRGKLHYRGANDPHGMEGHVIQRANDQERTPRDVRGDDAKDALRALYDVLEVAAIDIDPEKLP